MNGSTTITVMVIVMPGSAPPDHADQGADEERHQVLPLQHVDEAGAQQLEHQKFGPAPARQQHRR